MRFSVGNSIQRLFIENYVGEFPPGTNASVKLAISYSEVPIWIPYSKLSMGNSIYGFLIDNYVYGIPYMK